MYIRCPRCNSNNRLNARFCRVCGNLLYKDETLSGGTIICPECKRIDRVSAKKCRCGYDFEKIKLRGGKTKLIDSPCIKIKKSDLQERECHQALQDPGSLADNLMEIFEIDIENLMGLLNYQRYLFEISEKGLAVIEEETGRFIAVNSRFEKISGYSRDSLVIETFDSLICKINPKNTRYKEILLQRNKFWVFNGEDRKISVKVFKNNGLFKNNSLLIMMEDVAENILKKDRETTVRKGRSATRNLHLITRIAEEINSSLDIEVIFTSTLDKVMSATTSDVALIMFMEEGKTLVPIASKGISEKLLDDLKTHTIKADVGSSARALSLGRTVDIKSEDSHFNTTDNTKKKKSLSGFLMQEENLLSMAVVPLKSRDEIIGIISLGSRRKESYSGKHLELLDSIANHITIAIKNSRLYSQTREQLKELEEKNRRLRELEEMKERLTRMIVHDLKSPLSGIMAYADYVKSQKGISRNKLIEFFDSIHESTQDTLRMVMNLLDISKMEDEIFNLKLSIINPSEILDKVLQEADMRLEKKKLDVIEVVQEDLPELKADKNIIYRIITNLIDNAIKYSDPDGKITVEITFCPKDNKIIFCVADEGPGIPESYREKIFESFFTIDRGEENITTSTGIGLSFCKLAVEAHGGKILVEENTPRGSKFYFDIPVV